MFRVLVVGCGSIGERHVRCLQATGRAEVAICEVRQELRRRIQQQYAAGEAFDDVEAALAAKWDAAVVATPAPSHVPIARELAEAGVHLLIEKPLATTTQGVEQLAETVKSRGLVAAVAYVYRAHPVLAAMREAICGGRFGRPLEIVAVCGQNFPFYRPAYREIYYADRAAGGGAVQDALTHIVNACEWIAGPVDRLSADAAHQHLEGVAVEDTVHVLARHGGVLASYSLNQYQAPNEIAITVVCEGGTARFELHRCRWQWMSDPGGAWHDEPHPPLERDEWFKLQEHSFLDAVAGEAPPLCTLEEGVQTLKVNLAILDSADRGAAPVEIRRA